ncbi:MAG: DNA starvation/stationary phase protection protein [Idiomarina sp.]|nr:DNA starvation/stationary phase protection protein [Idiomarina sp.]
MKQVNVIGLDQEGTKVLARRLNALLSNYQVLYMNVRGFHWNVRGERFFELHAKFEETYNDLLLKIDEIAERILTLGQKPQHSYSTYLQESTIAEATNIVEGRECVQSLLEGYKILIRLQRELLDAASELSDEGTASLMGDYIKEQEKTCWMLTAYLD